MGETLRKGTGLGSLDDLRGKVLAFKAPESTPGHFVPRALLLSRGYRLVELKRPGDPVPPDAIGYVFAHGDRTALAWVIKGVVEAAVVKDDFYEQEIAPEVRDRLAVLGRTPAVPRQVLMHRAELDSGLRAALEAVLLGMHRDDEGAGRWRSCTARPSSTASPAGRTPPSSESTPCLTYSIGNGSKASGMVPSTE